LAADPCNLSAIEEIYRVKGRPENRALPILVNSIEQTIPLTRDLPANFLTLAQKFLAGSAHAAGGCFAAIAAQGDREQGARGVAVARFQNCVLDYQ